MYDVHGFGSTMNPGNLWDAARELARYHMNVQVIVLV